MDENKDSEENKQTASVQPGTVISPGSPPETTKPKDRAESAAEVAQTELPAPELSVAQPEPELPSAPETEPEEADFPDQVDSSQLQSVSWTATEFIDHDKSASWYLGLAAGAIILAGLIFLVTEDFISVAVVIVAALILGVYGSHKPRQLQYQVDQKGITIGTKYHGYQEYKSFSVVPEGTLSGITFMPLKRFSPTLTIYFVPEDEDKILGVLSNHLPFEEPRRDAVESLMRRIRF